MAAEQTEILMSVVVPCYMAERTLPACLDSLLAQECEGSYEIICVNDGSRDGTQDIIDRYIRENPGIVRGISKRNEGPWAARMDGIAAAQGHYIGFLDSDDTVIPTYAQTLLRVAEKQQADIVVCGFSRTDSETGKVLSREFCEERAPFTVTEDPGRIIEVNPAPWNKLIRRELLQAVPELSNTPLVLEDLALMLLVYPNPQVKIAFAPISCVNYMVHEGSLINTVTTEQVAIGRAMFLEIRQHYINRHVSVGLLSALDAVIFLHLGISMALRLLNSPGVVFSQEMKRTTKYLDEYFPTWRHSPYIRLSYARAKGPAYMRLLIAQRAYKAHLITPLLSAYGLITGAFGFDIKW